MSLPICFLRACAIIKSEIHHYFSIISCRFKVFTKQIVFVEYDECTYMFFFRACAIIKIEMYHYFSISNCQGPLGSAEIQTFYLKKVCHHGVTFLW